MGFEIWPTRDLGVDFILASARAVYWDEPERRCIRSSWFRGLDLNFEGFSGEMWPNVRCSQERLEVLGCLTKKRMQRSQLLL